MTLTQVWRAMQYKGHLMCNTSLAILMIFERLWQSGLMLRVMKVYNEDEIDGTIQELDKKVEEGTKENCLPSHDDQVMVTEIYRRQLMIQWTMKTLFMLSFVSPIISFLKALDHIETLWCLGTYIGASFKELGLFSKLECTVHWIQLSKQRRDYPLAVL